MLWKYFYIKNLWLHVKEVYEKNLQACNCARVSIKLGETTRNKRRLL